jgi:molybdenum cofactor cytidylyltransferase
MNARVGCVILAAGESRRLGGNENKLVLPLDGKPLLQHAVDAASASGALACTLVVGANAAAILGAIDTRRCAVVENFAWREGIASSIRAGLAQHLGDAACIFTVADQPFVTVGDLNGLIECFAGQRDAMVAIRSGSVWGTPMLFAREHFRALFGLRGDFGAKRYAEQHEHRLHFVNARDRDAFADVDTLEDYERLSGC